MMEMESAEQGMQPVPIDALQCPICVEIPQSEIYQCRNGHSFCVTCSNKLKKCPTCKTKLPVANRRVRNRFMEELIGCTTIPCKYKQDGCDKLVSRKESVAHFASCEFRPFHLCQKIIPTREFRTCPFGSSKASEIFNHFAGHHHQVKVFTTQDTFFAMTKAVDKLRRRESSGFYNCSLFEMNSSKGDVAKYFQYYRIGLRGDSIFMCLYLGEKATDVSPFFVKLTVKGSSEEEQWIWEGRPKHYKKADVVVKFPPLKVCLDDMIDNGEGPGPGLTVNFYEKY